MTAKRVTVEAPDDRPISYREALAWLYSTQRFGIKLGLQNAQRLFAALDLLPLKARVIHVAGTNGKGSVCAMAAAICRAAGYRTALFTSPHLLSYRERIQVNGELISEADTATRLGAIRGLVRDWQPHPTFFEITTALALHYFRERDCEVVILETGLGGRLDATNVVTPALSVLTPIEFDHQAWLGDTIEKIAAEKAGIIKPRVPVISAKQRAEAEAVIAARALECEAPLRIVAEPLRGFEISLPGEHQQQNAALAVAALGAAQIEVSTDAIARGLQEVNWPARFQRFSERIIIDGAHNAAGARVLVQTWRHQFGNERATIIAGMLGDKDVAAVWQALTSIARRIFLPQFRSSRALDPEQLKVAIEATTPDVPIRCFPSIAEALEAANREPEPILIAGSLHFSGEALATLAGDSAAYEECAQ